MIKNNVLDSDQQMAEKEAEESKKQMKEGLVLRDDGIDVEGSLQDAGTLYNDTHRTPDKPSPATKNQESDVGAAEAPSTSTSAVPASLRKVGAKNIETGVGCGVGFGHVFGIEACEAYALWIQASLV